jgi:hypothetical protein
MIVTADDLLSGGCCLDKLGQLVMRYGLALPLQDVAQIAENVGETDIVGMALWPRLDGDGDGDGYGDGDGDGDGYGE